MDAPLLGECSIDDGSPHRVVLLISSASAQKAKHPECRAGQAGRSSHTLGVVIQMMSGKKTASPQLSLTRVIGIRWSRQVEGRTSSHRGALLPQIFFLSGRAPLPHIHGATGSYLLRQQLKGPCCWMPGARSPAKIIFGVTPVRSRFSSRARDAGFIVSFRRIVSMPAIMILVIMARTCAS